MMLSEREIEKFYARYEEAGKEDCWHWVYHKNHYGHGRMWANGRHTLATHIALFLSGRPRPEQMAALHSCDNPSCVNPSHLRWGTQAENVNDMHARKRAADFSGDRNPNCKITEEQASSIRQDTRSSAIISAQYGISRSMVCAIRRGVARNATRKLEAAQAGKIQVPVMRPAQAQQG